MNRESVLFTCKYVADLFEYSTKENDCSSKVFIKAFVFSSLAKRIFSKYFILESIDIPMAYDVIKKEKKLTRGKDVYPSYVMSWIGYIMAYFQCKTNLPISVLYNHVKPDDLYKVYEAYHSLDNDLVVDRIIEAGKINTNLNDVNILKKVYGIL